MAKRVEVNCETGETRYIDLTDEEIAANEANAAAAATAVAAQEAADTKAATDAAAGKAKLKDLGLTDDQITALVG